MSLHLMDYLRSRVFCGLSSVVALGIVLAVLSQGYAETRAEKQRNADRLVREALQTAEQWNRIVRVVRDGAERDALQVVRIVARAVFGSGRLIEIDADLNETLLVGAEAAHLIAEVQRKRLQDRRVGQSVVHLVGPLGNRERAA